MTNSADQFTQINTRDPKKLDITRTTMPVNKRCMSSQHCTGTYLMHDSGDVKCSQCNRGTITKVSLREV